jgi:hypothetical protein
MIPRVVNAVARGNRQNQKPSYEESSDNHAGIIPQAAAGQARRDSKVYGWPNRLAPRPPRCPAEAIR